MSSEDEGPVAWLRPVIEGDLALARRVLARWVVPADRPDAGRVIWPAPSVEALMVFRGEDPDVNAGLELIRLCSPAAVVADCEAKLAILDLYERQAAKAGESALQEDRAWTLEPVIALLASGYRHRPRYEEAGWTSEQPTGSSPPAAD